MKPYLTSLTILSLALMSLVTYSFTTAQWVNPPASPPNSNVPAPINVGSGDQIKAGGLEVNSLRVNTDARVIGTTTADRTHSRLFCNELGTNCFAPAPGATTWASINSNLHVNGMLNTANNVYIDGNLTVTGGITGGGSLERAAQQLGGGMQLYRCPEMQPGSWGHSGCYSSCVGQITTMSTCRFLNQSGGNCTHSGPHQFLACTPVN